MISVPAGAINIYPLVKGTPAEHFTDTDFELFIGAIPKALNDTATGGNVDWKNEQTGASGRITVDSEFRNGGRDCRRVRIEMQANKRKGRSAYDLCRRADDSRWDLFTPK